MDYLYLFSKFAKTPDIPTLPFFPGVSRFLVHSPGFSKNSKINVQVIETHVGFSDTCGNGLTNLSFVPKSKVHFDCG